MTALAASPSRRHVLEPLRPALIGVSLVHLALAALVVWLASAAGTSSSNTPPSPPPADSAPSLAWFRPADFQAPLPLTLSPASTDATPPPAAARNASRYITLSRVTSASTSALVQNPNPSLPSPSSATTPDAATLSELDRIDEALYEAFMQVWTPPDIERLPATKRTTRLDISLTPEIALVQADLVSPSGSTDLDLSVLLAAEKVAERLRDRTTSPDSSKFPKSLPSSFQNSRYVCRIQFQIE
jgi:hypothetical protein